MTINTTRISVGELLKLMADNMDLTIYKNFRNLLIPDELLSNSFVAFVLENIATDVLQAKYLDQFINGKIDIQEWLHSMTYGKFFTIMRGYRKNAGSPLPQLCGLYIKSSIIDKCILSNSFKFNSIPTLTYDY